MSLITWNTDVNAPGCPGEIVNGDGRTVLVQTDWDYPGVASSFGWDLASVQRCGHCRSVSSSTDGLCGRCDEELSDPCDHSGTDGTVDCRACGVTAGAFIEAAGEWLGDNNGVTADDPGYF